MLDNKSANIAICLAAYNGIKYLQPQIDSLLNLTNVNIKIFISIDLSTDDTFSFLDNWSHTEPKLTILDYGQHFGSASANFFRLINDLNFSNYDFICFCDQDDIWFEDKLSHAIATINSKNIDGYSSNVMAFWPDGRQKFINKSQKQTAWDYMFESAGPGCTFVLTKKLILDLQSVIKHNQANLNSVALHDWFIYAFARSRNYTWFIDHDSKMLYRQHANNVVGANIGLQAIFSRWKQLRTGWLINQAILIAEILDYSNAWPIQKIQRYYFTDRLLLIFTIHKLRRRLRDRIVLAAFFLLPV